MSIIPSHVALPNHEHLIDVLSNKLFSVVFYQIHIHKDGDRKFNFISKNVEKQIGYTSEEILQDASILYSSVAHEHKFLLQEKELDALQNIEPLKVNFQFQAKDGSIKWLQIQSVPTLLEDGSVLWDGIQTDVSDIKLHEQKLNKVNRELALLNKVNDKILKETSIAHLFQSICSCIVTEGNYVLAWISKKPLPTDESQIAAPIAKFGAVDYLNNIVIDLKDPLQKNGPTATALLTGKPVITNNFQQSLSTIPWKNAAAKYNIEASMVLPISLSIEHIGTLNIYSDKIDAFDTHEVEVLKRIAENISLSVRAIQTEQEKEKANYLLNERIKELRTLYFASQTLQNLSIPVDEVLHKIVHLLHRGFQFPDWCAAKIVFDNQQYITNNYRSSSICIKAPIQLPNTEFGYIEVVYLQNEQINSTLEFLEEEQNLINAIAKLIGDYLDWRNIQTKLEQSQANLSTIFKSTDIGYILLDMNYSIVAFNESMQDGYANHTDIQLEIGKNFPSILHPNRKEFKISYFEKVIQQKSSIAYEIEHKNNGLIKFFRIGINPVIDQNSVIGLCLSAFDITNEKALALESQKTATELIQRNRDLEQFAYILSHNIRAPLANIIGLNSLLQTSLSCEDQNEVLHSIAQSAEILDGVVKDVSKILRVRREVSELKEEVFFEEITNNIIESIQNVIQEKSVQIRTNFSKLSFCFSLKTYVVSIFQNLIINSIKYSNPAKQPLIEIWSELKGEQILIHFKDNGIGIDMEKNGAYLFGLYKRFHHHVEGKGIGLYMVKSQVLALGGTITATSEVNVGTEFIVTLPSINN